MGKDEILRLTMLFVVVLSLLAVVFCSECIVKIDGTKILPPDEYAKIFILLTTSKGTLCTTIDNVTKCVELKEVKIILPDLKIKNIEDIGYIYRIRDGIYYIKFKVRKSGTYTVIVNASLGNVYCSNIFTIEVREDIKIFMNKIVKNLTKIINTLENINETTRKFLSKVNRINKTLEKIYNRIIMLEHDFSNLVNMYSNYTAYVTEILDMYNRIVVPYFNKSITSIKSIILKLNKSMVMKLEDSCERIENFLEMYGNSISIRLKSLKRSLENLMYTVYSVLILSIVIISLLVWFIVTKLRKR